MYINLKMYISIYMYIYIYIYIWQLLFCPCVQQRPPSKSEPTFKVPFIWVPEVGTSRGHEPIKDQSCGAVIFPLIELIEIYPPVTFPEPYNGYGPSHARNTGQHNITYIPLLKNIFSKGLTMFIYTANHAELKFLIDFIESYG